MPVNETVRAYVTARVEEYAGDHSFRPLWCSDCRELIGWSTGRSTADGEAMCTACLRAEAGE